MHIREIIRLKLEKNNFLISKLNKIHYEAEQMNYLKIYENLIANAKIRESVDDEIYEKHHIIPKSLGGSNKSDNLVLLTLREHFIAHLLLYKINKNNPYNAGKMISALNRMTHSKRYSISSRYYVSLRKQFILNHPCKNNTIKDKIKNSLRQSRLNVGWTIAYCGCGCGQEVKLLDPQNKSEKTYFLKNHKPKKLCSCGCNTETVNNRLFVEGHEAKIKCACGCGADTYKNYNYQHPNLKVFKNGHDKDKNNQISKALKEHIRNLSDEKKSTRIKNSLGKSLTSQKRFDSIKHAKSSSFVLVKDSKTIKFNSYDNVEAITGYSYSHILYAIKQKNGILKDGSVVYYTKRYYK